MPTAKVAQGCPRISDSAQGSLQKWRRLSARRLRVVSGIHPSAATIWGTGVHAKLRGSQEWTCICAGAISMYTRQCVGCTPKVQTRGTKDCDAQSRQHGGRSMRPPCIATGPRRAKPCQHTAHNAHYVRCSLVGSCPPTTQTTEHPSGTHRGGRGRNRTALRGLALRCITTLPLGRPCLDH